MTRAERVLSSAHEPVIVSEEVLHDGPPATDEKAPAQALFTAGRRRLFLQIAACSLLLATLVPLGLWAHFKSTHVVTRNALVRSHLSELGVRVEGVVREVLVDAGDAVAKGELLARLDDRHLQTQRMQAEAAIIALDERIALKRSEQSFARRQAQFTQAQSEALYRQMQAEAQAAQLRAEDAGSVYASREALGADGAISGEVIRNAAAKAATQRSLAEAAAAAEAVSLAELNGAQLATESLALYEAEIRVLLATRREADARLAQVQANIDSTRVLAPEDGHIVRRLAQPGMSVDTATPLLSVWLSGDTWIEAWVPEESLGAVHPGSTVNVSFPALPGERFVGTVTRIGLVTDFEMPLDYLPQTREARMRPTPQVGVQVRLDVPPALLRPGMSAVVDIHRGEV